MPNATTYYFRLQCAIVNSTDTSKLIYGQFSNVSQHATSGKIWKLYLIYIKIFILFILYV